MTSTFEQGPIRPPSEAQSLLIRVTRNCPWNRCHFCPVYKGETFSRRPVQDVLADIDGVARHVDAFPRGAATLSGDQVRRMRAELDPDEEAPFRAALHWFTGGMQSVFLQDADGLRYAPDKLAAILGHLRLRFPWSPRVTAYSRSRTLARHGRDVLATLREAGLSRIHAGVESGSGQVLDMMQKGATPEEHIRGLTAAREAGLEVSIYVMPGLGGREHSREHALETARVAGETRPHFIRLRSLAVIPGTPLADDVSRGLLVPLDDDGVAREIRIFLKHLDSPGTTVASDHILNLLEGVRGVLPQDKAKMLAILDSYLELPDEERLLYRLGRRMGVFSRPEHLALGNRRRRAEEVREKLGVTAANIDEVLDGLMARFV